MKKEEVQVQIDNLSTINTLNIQSHRVGIIWAQITSSNHMAKVDILCQQVSIINLVVDQEEEDFQIGNNMDLHKQHLMQTGVEYSSYSLRVT
jgi:hypothetical protein